MALARALAPGPRVLLLDEPLSNLDPTLRERTRRELRAALRRIGITTLLVTHEQEEAFELGDRVALLNGGRLEQVGTPEELYGGRRRASSPRFIGRASLLRGRLRRGAADEWRVASARTERAPQRGGLAWAGELVDALQEGDAAELMLRPEALALVRCRYRRRARRARHRAALRGRGEPRADRGAWSAGRSGGAR